VNVLDVEDLSISYQGTIRGLRHAGLTVAKGEVVTVLGSNGAGKTTLLRAISGTLSRHRGAVDTGTITFLGTPLGNVDAAKRVRLGIVQVPEGRRIFGRLTVEENLRAGATAARDRSSRGEAQERVFSLFPVLAERRLQRAGLLSGGEQQMLAMGRALMSSPELLILDEPSLGLAPRIVTQIGDIIEQIHGAGTSVLLVEQNAGMALRVATRAYVLELGHVILEGPVDVISNSDQVRDLYLGHATADAATETAGRRSPAMALTRWVP
jgi:branched-chain amino acid transport system ATP-binding protein